MNSWCRWRCMLRPRKQHRGLIADEPDRGEVGKSVVERLVVKRLVYRHHVNAAVQRLIAVEGCVRDARRR